MDNITKRKLDKILRSDEFDALVKLYGETIDKWNEQNVIGKNEFETLKLLFTREGKKEGLKEFFETIEGKFERQPEASLYAKFTTPAFRFTPG